METQDTAETWIARDERWHAQHEEFVDAWVEWMGGPTPWEPVFELYRVAARALLRIPEARAEGRGPGEPEREAYVWDEIDAYEVLFCHVVHAGRGTDVDPAEYLRLIGSFAGFLGEQGVIGLDEHTALQRDWGVWSQRLLKVWADGGWYFADGTHRSPHRLEEQRGEPAETQRHNQGGRFVRHRRRTRPLRRR